MLTLEGITKYYKEIKAIEGVTFTVRQGEFLAIVGPNGSGKSTLMRIMLGIVKPTAGRVLFNGEPLNEVSWRELRRRIGYMPERVSFYDNLTGMETLRLFARVKRSTVDKTVERILPRKVLERKVGSYSKGMRQRINLIQALLASPDIVVMDEPTSGLDPMGIAEFYSILSEIRQERPLTVVLSSHILAEVEGRADRVAIMKDGNLKAIGSLRSLYRKLRLPLKVFITLKGKDPLIERLLSLEGATGLTYRNGYLIANVPPENKMKILSSLMEKKNRFEDISITEPGLEEVFFGLH
ncbi:MAG: ABC transporter ATP-binding protein [Nitrospirae bacterium]|nr:ABC transporter ATP-binding protein [Nitrospirota bacterium]